MTAPSLLAIPIAFLLAACSRDAVQVMDIAYEKPRPEARTEAACSRAGGSWVISEVEKVPPFCVLSTSDAGAACKSVEDCATMCVVEGKEKAEVGDPVEGACHDTYLYMGCHSLVDGGKYVGTYCID